MVETALRHTKSRKLSGSAGVAVEILRGRGYIRLLEASGKDFC